MSCLNKFDGIFIIIPYFQQNVFSLLPINFNSHRAGVNNKSKKFYFLSWFKADFFSCTMNPNFNSKSTIALILFMHSCSVSPCK